VTVGEEMIEGYHLFVGGGHGTDQHLAREVVRDIPAPEAGPAIERILRAYVERRHGTDESFPEFTRRHTVDQLRDVCAGASPQM